MRIKLFMLLSLVLIILLAGCVKVEEMTEIKYKNDIITIENFNIDNLSPYSGGRTTLSFDVANNGDREVQYLEVNFFDIPGFTSDLDCGLVDKTGTNDKKVGNICVYKNLDSLDSRTLVLKLTAPKVNYPTEYKISYSISYVYYGIREALIPVIDGITKNQPSGQFRQSEPTLGPIQANIQPKLERDVKVGDKTIKQYWAIADNTFETDFKFSHIGAVSGQKREINITSAHIGMKLNGLNSQTPCDFSGSTTSTSTARQVVIPFVVGLNFVSLPVVPIDNNIETILSSIKDKVESVWYYDTSLNWKVYTPSTAPNDLLTLEAGKGYRFKMKEVATLQITGMPYEFQPINLEANNYYMIGTPFEDTKISDILGTCNLGNLELSSIDANGNKVPVDINSDMHLSSGKGYWIKSTNTCTLRKTVSIPTPTPVPAYVDLVNFTFEDFKDKITQKDVVLRQKEEAKITGYNSTKNVIIPKDSLICVFSPTATGQPESTASIALVFAYKYEFIRSESFAIQPLR